MPQRGHAARLPENIWLQAVQYKLAKSWFRTKSGEYRATPGPGSLNDGKYSKTSANSPCDPDDTKLDQKVETLNMAVESSLGHSPNVPELMDRNSLISGAADCRGSGYAVK
jgi:hypothetical protein